MDKNEAQGTHRPQFVLLGVAGYIAPRHLEAIRANNGQLLAAIPQ